MSLSLQLTCIPIGSPNVMALCGEVFNRVSQDHALMQQLYGTLNNIGGIFTLARSCGEESTATLKKCRDLTDDEFQLMVKDMPVRKRIVLMQWDALSIGSMLM